MSYFFIPIFLAVFLLFILGNFSYISVIQKFCGKNNIKKGLLISLSIVLLLFVLIFLLSKFWFPGMRWVYFYLGFLNFAFFSSVTFWLLYFIFYKLQWKKIITSKKFPLLFVFLPIIISLYASYNFFSGITVENFTIKSNKITQEYTFVQVTDIQYGTVTKEYMQKVIDVVQKQNPDFVLFTGDLIDFNDYAQEDFHVLSAWGVPVFFERGNHEFYHNAERFVDYLSKVQNVNLLINEKSQFEELDIVGVDFQDDDDNYFTIINNIPLDESRFNILMYHEPKFIEESVALGYDMLLYGHVHGGQIWPYTKIIDIIYEYGDGLFEVDGSTIYTSDGSGLWGPRMRLDSQNEIAVFHLQPE